MYAIVESATNNIHVSSKSPQIIMHLFKNVYLDKKYKVVVLRYHK